MWFLKTVEAVFLRILTWLSLSLTYFLGIGPTALVAKLVGKKFLKSHQETSWQKPQNNTSLDRMF